MQGIAVNATTKRYFESGQMINHEYMLLKDQEILQDTFAETEMHCLKYSRKTF